MSARRSSRSLRTPASDRPAPPASRSSAAVSSSGVWASTTPSTASACTRSSRPVRNARRVNSPPRARRAPWQQASAITASTSGADDGSCTSARGPPIGPAGPGQASTVSSSGPQSRLRPSAANRTLTARGRSPGAGKPAAEVSNIRRSTASSPWPAMRTIARPPAPGTVAAATISSSADHMGCRDPPGRHRAVHSEPLLLLLPRLPLLAGRRRRPVGRRLRDRRKPRIDHPSAGGRLRQRLRKPEPLRNTPQARGDEVQA